MSALRAAAAVVLLGFVAVVPAHAQGLGDTAARERAKRAAEAKKKKEPSKSFTNDDLEAGRPPGSKPAESASQAPPPTRGEDQPSAAPADDPAARDRPYLDAVSSAQQALTGAETRVRALSEKLNPMSVSYIYGAGGSNDANEELRVRAELRQAEADLQAARQALATANQNLQAVRQGRPPGPLEER